MCTIDSPAIQLVGEVRDHEVAIRVGPPDTAVAPIVTKRAAAAEMPERARREGRGPRTAELKTL